jgi:hypothetical protein
MIRQLPVSVAAANHPIHVPLLGASPRQTLDQSAAASDTLRPLHLQQPPPAPAGPPAPNATPPANPPSADQVVSGTPGASVGNTGGSTDMVVGGFDVTQVASSIPWWGWALGAGAVALMLSRGRR